MIRNDLRNVAIIAHVDHGKTTLVDQMLRQSGTFRENQVVEERVMDSNALERERGITILAKNTSVHYHGVKINIIDTPGHADFGGEVERVLKMVNGVLLLVDAAEGPMPQTRFVMQKALELNHKLIIVVNKVDRPDARIAEVQDEILDLLIDLNASDDQVDSPIVFCSGRAGTASRYADKEGKDLTPLFDTILNHIPPMEVDETAPMQLLVSSIDYNDYVGRIGIGRIERGVVRANQDVAVCNHNIPGMNKRGKLVNLYQIEGLSRVPVESAKAGDIVCFSGLEGINIGDTVCVPDAVEAVPFVKISEPTVEMTFSVNDSPFAGKEGKFVTSRHLRELLYRELLKDVSLKVENTGSAEAFDSAAKALVESAVYTESNELETAAALYRAVSSGCTYAESEENSLYRMIVEKEGGCAEFAAALSYLFNQNGIPAQVASGTAGDSEHFWVIAELGGKSYHFDPTFENSATGGLGLSYFGMSDAARTYTGCALPCTVGRGGYTESLDAPCPDTRFDEFFTDVTSWDCDVQTHFLYLAYGFEEDYLNSVQTDTLLDGAE